MATLQMYMDKSRIENTFTSEEYREVWGDGFGISNAIGKVRRIIVHRPGEELLKLRDSKYEEEAGARILKDEKGRIRSYWKGEGYPDIPLMQEQHDAMTKVLRDEGIEVINWDDPRHEWPNMTFARDFAEMTPNGAIMSRYAFVFHQGETPIGQKLMADLGVPIVGAIQGKGTMEGGSFCLMDPHTAVVGRSVRINDEGIDEMRRLLSYQGIDLIVIDMPAFYIHLDEAFIPVDRDKILCSTFILPFWFLDLMEKRGYKIIETDRDDPFLTNNCLTLEPGKVLFSAKGTRTIRNLQAAGVEVIPVDISEINKLGGGIHCSTLPILRDPVDQQK